MSSAQLEGENQRYILIYGNDAKVRNWAAAISAYGCELVPMPGSGARIGMFLIASTLRRRQRPAAVVFRYLNDYPSLLRSVARALTEVFAVLTCILLRVRVLWICHNVDRETYAFHPRLSNFRRNFLVGASTRVFVTDPLLEAEAYRRLPAAKGRIRTVTFGAYVRSIEDPAAADFNHNVARAIAEWRNMATGERPLLVGLCAGAPAPKVLHYGLIPSLISVAAEGGFDLRMIVVGELDEFLKINDPSVLDFFRQDNRVFYHGRFVPLDELWLANHIDFYWRAYTDLSIPFSFYVAATAGKPILSYGESFQSRVVTHYRLGSVMKSDFSNSSAVLGAIARWNRTDSNEFLCSHTWALGARELYRAAGLDLEAVDQCDA